MPASRIGIVVFLMAMAVVVADDPKPNTESLPEGATARLVNKYQRDGQLRSMLDIADICYSANGKEIWTLNQVGDFTRWDADNYEVKSTKSPLVCFWKLLAPSTNQIVDSRDSMSSLGICDAKTGKTIKSFGDGSKQRPLTVSPDGQVLLATQGGDDLKAWHVPNGKLITTVHNNRALFRPRFASDSRSLFVSVENQNSDYGLQRISAIDGTCLQTYQLSDPDMPTTGSCPNAVAVSPDGRRIYVHQQTSLLQVLELSSGQVAFSQKLEGLHARGVEHILEMSPDGTMLVIASRGTMDHLKTFVWDARQMKVLARWEHPKDAREVCLAFSPDSTKLATANGDGIVWDLTPIRPKASDDPLSENDLEKIWSGLAADARTAFATIGKGIGAPKSTLRLLKDRLRCIPTAAVTDAVRLIADLDDRAYEVREKAERDLLALGQGATGHLQKALEDTKVSAEARARIEKIRKTWLREGQREDRALEILEAIGTPAAKELLEELAKGEPSAKLTQDAKAGLERLKKRADTSLK